MALDVLLISPPSPLPYATMFLGNVSGMPALGIGYIAAYLRGHGFSVECLNLSLGIESMESFKGFLVENKPKIVGFSTTTENHRNGLTLAEICKRTLRDAITVFGGPHVTFTDEETLENKWVDVVVRNEGEQTMLELAKYFIGGVGSMEDIKGISYRCGGGLARNPARGFVQELDIMPFPLREFLTLRSESMFYDPRVMMVTSRGCPHRCKFCAASAMSGGRYRMRSPDNVMAEIQDLRKHHRVDVIGFGDDTVTADIPRLLNLCEMLKKERVRWSAESRVDVMSKDLAKIMAESGCIGIQFGVESGSQEVLDKMGKDISIGQVEKAVGWATGAGITVVCSMIIGTPWDTADSIRSTVDFGEYLQEKYGVAVLLSVLTPFPGTYIWNHMNELGVSICSKNYNHFNFVNPIIDTKHLSHWEIRRLHFDSMLRLCKSMPSKHKELFSRDILSYMGKPREDISFPKESSTDSS